MDSRDERQVTAQRKPSPSAPSLEAMDGSVEWYETGPEPILQDEALSTLVVRVGMASNSLTSQVHQRGAPGVAGDGPVTVERMRDSLAAFLTATSAMNEALRLAREEVITLRWLAESAGANKHVLEELEQLCAGTHPVSALLTRSHKLGLHWDPEVVRSLVREYRRSERLVWLETGPRGALVMRMSVEMLGHSLFPELRTGEIADDAAAAVIRDATTRVHDATNVLVYFFAAATLGFMETHGAQRKER